MGTAEKDDKVLTVSQLTNLIKTMLEGSFPLVQVKGEISNYRPSSSGHVYFVLKDTNAQLSAVMFRFNSAKLDFVPKDGMLVVATGSISVYPQRGNYQIIVNQMSKAGTGDIMEMIEERKRRLANEGLFDGARKRKLPFFPQTVGVVTSPTGAALRDILRISQRRNSKVNITVFPSIVQGEDAAPSIIRMIQIANRYQMCDVLIVGRGGGSLEDLLPFSDEGVVRAIASSQIPVISAVGHDIDWALSDFAADVRASTPSAAAELAVPELEAITQNLEQNKDNLYQTIESRIRELKLMVQNFKPENLEMQFRRIETPILQRFDSAKEELLEVMEDFIKDKRDRIHECTQILESCNPQEIFKRGYSMVRDAESGKIIRSGKDLPVNAELIITPAEGSIRAKVIASNWKEK